MKKKQESMAGKEKERLMKTSRLTFLGRGKKSRGSLAPGMDKMKSASGESFVNTTDVLRQLTMICSIQSRRGKSSSNFSILTIEIDSLITEVRKIAFPNHLPLIGDY